MFDVAGTDLLLVEGEAVLAELTAFRLELLGFRIRVVSTTIAAEAAITEEKPKLMIINSDLPDGDGLDFVNRLRSDHSAEDLPALVFSTNPTLDCVERAFACGAQDYVVIPFDPTVLEEKIQLLLKPRKVSSKRAKR